MKTYWGKRLSPHEKTLSEVIVTVTSGDRVYPLPLGPSLKVRNHSPTGFSWGYGGSGPAQLALAILLDLYEGNTREAQAHYQSFKRAAVARWEDEWSITSDAIEELLRGEEQV